METIYQVVDRITDDKIDVEDGGMAKIANPHDGGDEGMFVRIQSWGNHTDFDRLVGRQVRVTVEVL